MALDIPSLEVKTRETSGKGAARQLRRDGLVPGVVYGINEPASLTVSPRALEDLLGGGAGSNVVFQLDVEGETNKERPVIVRELQRDPVRGTIVHADFLELRMDQRIRVQVPIILQGEATGVKMGGTLTHILRELEVECLPISIPEEILLDVAGVDINDVLHVRDIALPEGVVLITEPADPVMTVELIELEEEAPAEEETEEGAEGEAPAEGAEEKKEPKSSESSEG